MSDTGEHTTQAALTHPRARQILLSVARRERELRATSHEALIAAGRGVLQDPACRALPVGAITWSAAAQAAIRKRADT
jgi:hypothetical protein